MSHRRPAHLIRSLLMAVLLMAVSTIGLGASPAAPVGGTALRTPTAPYCGLTWGANPKAGVGVGADDVLTVRAGRHACFDRLVIDLRNGTSAYRVEYVPAVYQDPSGLPIPLGGRARLHVVLSGMAFANGSGAVNHRLSIPSVRYFTSLRQIAFAGSVEGVTSFGLGVRGKLPFRAFLLAGPGRNSRLVIDVAHRW